MKAELFGNLNISFHDGFVWKVTILSFKKHILDQRVLDFFPPLLKYSNQNKLLIQGPWEPRTQHSRLAWQMVSEITN